jgi:hypothetical protein
MDRQRRNLFKLGGLLGAGGLVQEARSDNTDQTAAGSWMVQIAYDDTVDNMGSKGARKTAMCQFFGDGRWMGSLSAVNPDSSESWPANWRQASFHGEWRRRDRAADHQAHGMRTDDAGKSTEVIIQANRLRTDDAGNFVGNSTTTIQAILSPDGQNWTGTFRTTSRTLTGTGTFTGALTAVRM